MACHSESGRWSGNAMLSCLEEDPKKLPIKGIDGIERKTVRDVADGGGGGRGRGSW